MILKCNKHSLSITKRYFSSIFDVVRAKKCSKIEESRSKSLDKPNIKFILKRYEAIEPIKSNITKNEFVKKVINLRCLTIDALSHLPYYKCEDISAIIKFLSRIKYRDVILLQGLCEALYWQCNLNMARLRSITSVLSNLANLLYVPHLRITRTFCDQLDNPKNRQSIGDYTRLYKFLVFTNLMDSNHFIEFYQRIETKCLNSMGLMNHSQLALMSTILQSLPGGKWEIMDRICANFQRKLHEVSTDSLVVLLRNINRLRGEFKLAPKNCPLLISQIVNNYSLDNVAIITILQTMSRYYIRDPPILSRLGKMVAEIDSFTLDQQILLLNIFSQLNYKQKEFLSTRPLKTISQGISKLKLIPNCKSIGEIKELFGDFYQHLSVSRYKFIQFAIAYINCLAKVDYNKKELVLEALNVIKLCNIFKDDFVLIKRLSYIDTIGDSCSLEASNEMKKAIDVASNVEKATNLEKDNSILANPLDNLGSVMNEEINYVNSINIEHFLNGFNYKTTDEVIQSFYSLLPHGVKDAVPNSPSKRELLLSRFNYSKSGLLRIDVTVKDFLRDIAIKNYKPAEIIIPTSKRTCPFDNLEEFRASKRIVDRGGITLPIDCKVYRTKTVKELYSAFWSRTFGEYIQHPAHGRLQNRKLFKTMIKLLFRKKNTSKTFKHFQKSRLYGSEVMLETSSGVTDKEEIRRLYLKRKRYAGSKRSFESNLTYVNKWRLLRRCFIKPYSNLKIAFQSNKDDESYLSSIVRVYKNQDLSGFSFDSFINFNKNPIIYDTKLILQPITNYVRMGKTIKECKRIRDRYLDKWREGVVGILELNSTNCAKTLKPVDKNKNLRLLVGGLESLLKLDCQSHKYLHHVIHQVKKSDGNPVEQLTMANRLYRAMVKYDVNVIQRNKNILLDLYRRYIPMIGNGHCKAQIDADKLMYTLGNSLQVIKAMGVSDELGIDYRQLQTQVSGMKKALTLEAFN